MQNQQVPFDDFGRVLETREPVTKPHLAKFTRGARVRQCLTLVDLKPELMKEGFTVACIKL